MNQEQIDFEDWYIKYNIKMFNENNLISKEIILNILENLILTETKNDEIRYLDNVVNLQWISWKSKIDKLKDDNKKTEIDGFYEIRKLIKDLGAEKTVIFSTHDMSVAEKMCDFIFMIYKGKKVLDGTLETIQDAYGSDTVKK